MSENRYGCAPETACAGILCLKSFYLSSVGKNLRGEFQQNTHQLSRYIFNMLMHQNEHVGELGVILWPASPLYCYPGSVWL